MVKHKHGAGTTTPTPPHGTAIGATPGKQTLTQTMAAMPPAAEPDPSKAIFDDAATKLVAAGHHLQQDVSRWNVGLDIFNPGTVRAAGEQAMTDWLQVLQMAAMLRSSPMADAAEHALQSARELVAQLGLFHFLNQPINARALPIDDYIVVPHIEAQIQRAERTIADALRLFELCQGGKVAGMKLDAPTRLEVGQLLKDHSENDEETRWLEAFMKGTNIRHTVFSMGTDSEAQNLAMREVQIQQDEQFFLTTGNKHDFDAAEMAVLDDDAGQIVDFIKKEAYGWRTVGVLQKYTPEKRAFLIQLLGHRHQLDNMVHRAEEYGDSVQALIKECPGWGWWTYDYKRVTEKSGWDKADDVVTEMVDELPGAALSFAGGVYHEMGHLPAIGPVFERAGKSFDELAHVTDDAIGVDKDAAAMRDKISGGTGHVVAAIGVSGVGGEFVEAKRAYDAGSTLQKAADLVLQVRDGFESAKKNYGLVVGVLSEVGAGVSELATDAAAGDSDKWEHLAEHLGAALDVAIDKLGEHEGAELGGDRAEEEEKRKKQRDKKHEQVVDKAGDDAISPELRQAKADVDRSARLARQPDPRGTENSRARAAAQLKVDAAKMRELGERDALKVATARANAERQDDVAQSQAQAQQNDADKASEGKVEYYKGKLGDIVREVIVGFTVGALKGARTELWKEIGRGKIDGHQILVKALTKGGTDAILELVMPRAKKMLTTFFKNAIGDLLAQFDEDLRGAVSLAEQPIAEAVDWGIEQLGIEKWFEGQVEHLVEGLVGPGEKEGGEGGGEGGQVSAE